MVNEKEETLFILGHSRRPLEILQKGMRKFTSHMELQLPRKHDKGLFLALYSFQIYILFKQCMYCIYYAYIWYTRKRSRDNRFQHLLLLQFGPNTLLSGFIFLHFYYLQGFHRVLKESRHSQ